MKKKVAVLLILMIVLAVAMFASCNNDSVEYIDANVFLSTSSNAKTIYCVNAVNCSVQEKEMLASLQGIVAQTSACIYINYDEDSDFWMSKIKEEYNYKVNVIDDIWQLINACKSYVKDSKYVLYDSVADDGISYMNQSINYATVVSGAQNYLMISSSLEDKAQQVGFVLGEDVRNSSTRAIFDKYKSSLNNRILIHQNPDKWQLRDYAIANKAMCFYSDYYDGDSSTKTDILSWAAENCAVLGWTENETNFVASNSMKSKITVASDWAANLSFLSSLGHQDSYSQTNYQQRNLTAEQGKHYLAIVMSDGDNLQWMQNGFATDNKYFGSEYRGSYPLTWTIAPSMYNLNPLVLNYLYSTGTNYDQFIAGPSGAGYVNISDYNESSVAGYAQIAASYNKAMGIEYINFLDNGVNSDRLSEFAKYDSIKGGVWSVGNKYIEGGGAVYWCNDKPFVTVRETLWRIAGDDESNKYYGFTERVAQRINSYSTDPTEIEGYTVLVAHAWSIGSMDYINRFVDQLDDNVELVTVGELIDMVSKNVEHQDKEYLDDIQAEDIIELSTISSEQYTANAISDIPVDTSRTFDFDDKNTRNGYKWIFGNGGLQYDYAGYVSEGVKLDGSDLEDVIDPLPNSWTVNKFALTPADKYLTIFATHSSACNVNFRVRVLYVENESLVSTTLDSVSYEKTVNNYGWYEMDSASPLVYVYDLSQFAGKTIALSLEQDDTGDGSGEVVFISKLIISDKVEDGSDLTSWSASDIAAFWNKQGDVVRHIEGVCLEGKDASISCNITVTSNTLKIAMRKFQRPLIQGQDVTAYVIVKFNGNIIRVAGAFTDYIDVSNTNENYYYSYDISAYVGQTGTLEIISVEVAGVVGEHACIAAITF